MCTASRSAQSTPYTSPGGKETGTFLLHFSSFFHPGREFAVPCDEHGQVNLDDMSERVRNNYLYARAMLGREFAWPIVRCVPPMKTGAYGRCIATPASLAGTA